MLRSIINELFIAYLSDIHRPTYRISYPWISKRRQRPAGKNPMTIVDFFPFLCACNLIQAPKLNVVLCFLFFLLQFWFVGYSRAGPKGLRAESARAFTGRRNSHSGRGEDFLTSQRDFFTETAVTPERKVEKWFPRWEINRHAES